VTPRIEDAVRADDGRWIGIRCAACSAVFIGPDRTQRHADHTWECSAFSPGG
jgi:hypothetical protein